VILAVWIHDTASCCINITWIIICTSRPTYKCLVSYICWALNRCHSQFVLTDLGFFYAWILSSIIFSLNPNHHLYADDTTFLVFLSFCLWFYHYSPTKCTWIYFFMGDCQSLDSELLLKRNFSSLITQTTC